MIDCNEWNKILLFSLFCALCKWFVLVCSSGIVGREFFVGLEFVYMLVQARLLVLFLLSPLLLCGDVLQPYNSAF